VPCKKYASVLERVSHKRPDVRFVHVNMTRKYSSQQNKTIRELQKKYGMRGVPATILFKDGEQCGEPVSGGMDDEKLEVLMQERGILPL
jgi:thiol-disulfide isomerase/thioredoxin